MSDPTRHLKDAIIVALKADATIKTYCGTPARVYDRVPERKKITYPYIRFSSATSVGDDNECFDASEVNVSVSVFSDDVGKSEAADIAGEVRRVMKQEFSLMDGASPPVDLFRVVEAEFVTTRNVDAPDGLTSHAVVEFRYLVDHPKN